MNTLANCTHAYADHFWDDTFGDYWKCDNCDRCFEDETLQHPIEKVKR